MEQNKGKIDVAAGQRFLARPLRHVRRARRSRASARCAATSKLSPRGMGTWQPPYAPAGAVQNKITDAAGAEKMTFQAALGHACGTGFKARSTSRSIRSSPGCATSCATCPRAAGPNSPLNRHARLASARVPMRQAPVPAPQARLFGREMTRLDRFLAYRRNPQVRNSRDRRHVDPRDRVAGLAPSVDFGGLPVSDTGALSAATLNSRQIVALALFCAYMREAFDPLQSEWGPQSSCRVEPVPLGSRRQRAAGGGRIRLRHDGLLRRGAEPAPAAAGGAPASAGEQIAAAGAEMRLRILIETSPLAILTLDHRGTGATRATNRPASCSASTTIPCRGRRSLPTCRILEPPAAQPPLRRQHAHQRGMQGPRGGRARSSSRTSGSRPTDAPSGPGWPRWCGTPRRTCATAKAPGSIR